MLLPWVFVILLPVAITHRLINSTTGIIHGTLTDVNGKTVDIYLGIPYAKPPTGDRRFKRPEPSTPWQGQFNATKLPNTCPQAVDNKFGDFKGAQMWNPNTNINEDCLYLNVWAPMTAHGGHKKKATMIWLYGGGFWSGSSTLDLYDGRYLAAENDVIVASMQYRVGAFGFMYLGEEGAPGNMGLLDQQLAMKWIHDNIEEFGGDKNRITIFGESAGAISAGMHLLSPMSQNLFQYAILESAAPLPGRYYDEPEVLKVKYLQFAKELGCDFDEDVQSTLACLNDLNMETIVNKQCSNSECHMTNDNYFIKKSIKEYIQNKEYKRTPVLLGVNRDEGSYFLIYNQPELFNVDKESYVAELNEEQYDAEVKKVTKSSSLAIVKAAIRHEYEIPCDGAQPTNSYKEKLDDIIGDSRFICGVVQFADVFAESEDVYFYQYNHRSSANPWPEWAGVMHGYEIDMVFGQPLNQKLGYTREEVILSRRMMQYWTNFAKTGNPNLEFSKPHEWKVYGADKEYLIIDTNSPITTKKNLRQRECHLWNELIPTIWDHEMQQNSIACKSEISLGFLVTICAAIWMFDYIRE